MPSLNRNEWVACLECGRDYTHKDASRHRRTCGVLKCSNCNFYTYSSDELANHFKKKHSQHNIKLCAQQTPNLLQEKVKFLSFFLKNLEITMIFSFYWIWKVSAIVSKLVSNYTVFSLHYLKCHRFFYSKVLIDVKDSKNWVQIVVKLFMELDPKTFNQQ